MNRRSDFVSISRKDVARLFDILETIEEAAANDDTSTARMLARRARDFLPGCEVKKLPVQPPEERPLRRRTPKPGEVPPWERSVKVPAAWLEGDEDDPEPRVGRRRAGEKPPPTNVVKINFRRS